MKYSTTEKMNVLQMVRQGENVPQGDSYNYILFDLIEDGLIAMGNEPTSMYITYFGFKQLEDWDPVLQVVVCNQLLLEPYGEA